jgi:hypothetical protein
MICGGLQVPDKKKDVSKEVVVKSEQTVLPEIPLTEEALKLWIEERKKQEAQQ